jgi:hypothetical protein
MQYLKYYIVLIIFAAFTLSVFAQPVNDDCDDALEIAISDNGFDLGTFTSTTIDITDATKQIGEVFHNTQISAGNDKKTVWFFFYLPTARAVNLELLQPTENISQNGAGFTVFKTDNCLPDLDAITDAKLTPVNKFGSTYNPCLLPGNYLVQVSAQEDSDGDVYLELITDDPQVTSDYFSQATAYDFGTVSGGWHTLNFDAGCQSIQDENEVCPELGADYLEYTQSTWFVFTTDNAIDLLTLRIAEQSGFFTGNFRFAYNIYEGDVRLNDYSTLTLIDGCNVMEHSNESTIPARNYLCDFAPNTTYSIQVFFHYEYMNSVYLQLFERGNGQTLSPNPSSLNPSSQMGLLPSSASGEWSYGNDQFACNAFIEDNACGTVNPASGSLSIGGNNYQLSTWYTFSIDDYMNIRFSTNGYLGKRLFLGDVSTDCNLLPIEEFTSSNVTFNCLEPGTYSVQMLGKVDTSQNYVNSNYNHIGYEANLSLLVINNNISADFLLDATDQIDFVNENSGIWEALPEDIQISATTGRLNCEQTVLPDGETCAVTHDRAMYREIIVGDADGDGNDDSGVLTLSGGNYYLRYLFYRGSANELATAQGTFNWGETFTGLEQRMNCTNLYHSRKICVEPGKHTLVSYGDVSDVGRTDAPKFRFKQYNTLFDDPALPDDMGDISTALMSSSVQATPDYFSCLDNPLTIAGRDPCSGANKQIYRQFYIDQDMILNISQSGGNSFRLFYGRISDGIGTLSANIPGTGDIGCRSSYNTDVCNPLPAGWYTMVIYGSGGSYTGPDYEGGVIGNQTNISISRVEPLDPTNYHTPALAYDAGICDWGPNAGSSAYPENSQSYTFGTERFNCIDNEPLLVEDCSGFNRQAFYVFEITQESYLSFTGIPGSMKSVIYNADVRTDHASFPTMTPVQECINISNIGHYDRWWWTWNGKIDMCRMQPGVYTLIVYASDSHVNQTVTPTLYVDNVGTSRFDFAENAYDFDLIPDNNTFIYGKVGDVNPLDAGRAPSNDFFYCTTGAFPDDPGQADAVGFCWDGMYPDPGNPSVDYPMGVDFTQYNSNTNAPPRRNLWYSFVIDGPGLVTVKVENKTPGKASQNPFAVYKSDADGELTFADLISSGDVDSTLAQGLTFVGNNSTFGYYGCAGNQTEIAFNIDPCDNPGKQRFYVVVDQHVGIIPNSQVEVAIKHDAVVSLESRYDHFIDANFINGLNEVDPPYTQQALNDGVYQGDMSSFACATQATTDQNTCGERTLWYKFEADVSGTLRIQYEIDGIGSTFNSNDMMLFREVVPGDSTAGGLQQITPTSVDISGETWGETCLNIGTYYIMLTGCSYTIENVFPRISLISEHGDNCEQAVPIVMNALGVQTANVVVDCHDIGSSFGEDGTNMGCLLGPDGYKSTWFKVDLNFAEKADITYQLSENTSALPYQIRYRVLYGVCNAMTAGPCNTDALTEFTLNCMMSENSSYYVQVVMPENTIGDITLSVTATESPNQTCEPFDPLVPTANFVYENTCEGDLTCFTNQSSLGDSISYHWTFDLDDPSSDTSTEFSPCYEYPTDGVYNVQLIATNTELATADTVVVPVTIYPKPDPDISRTPADYEVVSGVSVDYFSNVTETIADPATQYDWDLANGNSSDENPANVVYGQENLGYNLISLTVTNGTCIVTDTDSIFVGYEPIYTGGDYDGATYSAILGVCPPEPIFAGGDYDGADYDVINGFCPPESIFAGGDYDGADYSEIIGVCPPESIFAGGFFDGAALNAIDGNCPVESIFAGGNYDGAVVSMIVAACPVEAIFAGGFYDGAVVTEVNADVQYTLVDDIICANDDAEVQVNTGTSTVDSIRWLVDGVFNQTISSSPFDFTVTLTGTSTITAVLFSPDVCDSTMTDFNVTVVQPPTADAGSDFEICIGESVEIGTATQAMLSYEWSPATGLDDAFIAQPTATPNTTTLYTLSVQDEDAVCPPATDDMTVTVNTDIPVISADDGFICNAGSINISVSGSQVGDDISWFFGDQSTQSPVMPTLPDGNLSASSEFGGTHTASRARLNATYDPNWSAASNNQNQWIKVDCGQVERITSIATQGRYGYDQWVTSYKVSYSNDNTNWTFIQEGASDKIFTGNSDRHTVVTHELDAPIDARYIRFHPWSWYGHVSMRIEVYKSDLIGDTETVSVSEPGTYYVEVQRANCTDTDSLEVVQSLFAAGSDAEICEPGQAVVIGEAAQDGFTYQWSPATYLDDENIAQPEAQPMSDITYTLTVTYSGMTCEDDMNIVVQDLSLSTNDVLMCDDVPVDITVAGTEAGDVVNWYTGSNDNINPILPGLDDSNMSASTVYSGSYHAHLGRLNLASDPNWTAALNDQNQWIKVDCGETTKIAAFATQGRYGADQWVTNYKVSYSLDDVNWTFIQEYGTDKIFDGNFDRNTVVHHDLDHFIEARYVRIHPVAWNTNISMRIELYEKTSIGTTATISVNQPDTYYAQVDRGVCSAIDSLLVIQSDHHAGEDVGVCITGESIQIGNAEQDDLTYAWSPATYLDNANVAQPTSTPNTDITYTVTVSHPSGNCIDEVDVFAPISVDAGLDQQICPGDIVNLNASGSSSINAWSWTTQLSGYKYEVEIENTSAVDLSDYQVKIVLNTQDLIANGKMQPDCADIRVKADDLTTDIPFWIADGTCNTSQTEIWVKTSVPAGTSITVYVLYSNEPLASQSNGDLVFEFFDDFNSPTIDLSKWTEGTVAATSGTNFSQSGGYLYGGNTNRFLSGQVNFTGNYIAETRVFTNTVPANGFTTNGFWASTGNQISILSHGISSYLYYRDDGSWVATSVPMTGYWARDEVIANGTDGNTRRFNETTGTYVWDRTFTNSGLDNEYIRLGARGDNGNYNQDYDAEWDWIFVRKYVDIPPSITLGAESFNGFATTQNTTVDESGQFIVLGSNDFCLARDTVQVTDISDETDALAWRTRNSGNWDNTTIWQVYDGTTWLDAETYVDACGNGVTFPDYQDSTILIRSGHQVDFNQSLAVDELSIEASAVLEIPLGQQFQLVDSSSSPIVPDLLNDGQIIVETGGELVGIGLAELHNNGRIDISGDFNIDGGFAPKLINAHSSTVAYNNGSQDLWNGTYGRLEVNGGGLKTVVGTVSKASNEVEFISGKILLGNRNFTMMQNAITSGASYATGYFITNNNGSLIKESLGAVGAESFTYHVGSSETSYNPAWLENSGTADNIRCRVVESFEFEDAFPNDELSEISSVDRTWFVSEDVDGDSDISINLSWITAHENAEFNAAECQVGTYDPTAGWLRTGVIGAASGAGVYGDLHAYQSDGITDLYAFTLGSCSVMPDTYRTIADGNWTDIAIWEVFDGTDWILPQFFPTACGEITYPTSNSNDIIVRHNVLYDHSIPQGIDQTLIEPQAVLTVPSGVNLFINDGTGDDIVNQGYLTITGSVTANAGFFMDNQTGSTVHYNGDNQELLNCEYADLIVEGNAPNAYHVKTVNHAGCVVHNHLYFDNAKIQLETDNFLVKATAEIHDYSENNGYFVVLNDGFLLMEIPMGINQSKEFPVGGTEYSPAMIEFNEVTTTGSMACRIREQVHPNNTSSIQRYWTFEQQGITFAGSYDMTLHYLETDLPYIPANALDEMSMLEMGGAFNTAYATADNWIYMENAEYFLNVDNDYAVLTHNQFSDFTLLSKNNPLPVTLISLSAEWQENDAVVKWNTASEFNNSGFDIERSIGTTDDFMKIGFVQGAGNSNQLNAYQFVDENLKLRPANDYYFRLKQIDYDGTETYSHIVHLNNQTEATETNNEQMILACYPNPVNQGEEVHLIIESDTDQEAIIEFYNAIGEQLEVNKHFLFSGETHIVLDTKQYSEAAYLLKLITDNHTEYYKVIISRKR